MEIVDQIQLVHTDGYKFFKPRSLKVDDIHCPVSEKYLVPLGANIVGINPLETENLHLEFSRLRSTEDDFARFAGKYGMLTHPSSWRIVVPGHVLGEPLSEWTADWKMLNVALRALRMAERLESSTTEVRRVELTHSFVTYRDDEPPFGPFARSFDPTFELWDELDLARPGDSARKVARWVAHALANARLLDHVAPQLLLTDTDKRMLFIQPQSLAGAIWLRFALALDEGRRLVMCENCGNVYQPKRPNASKWCSAACKQAAYRDRTLTAK